VSFGKLPFPSPPILSIAHDAAAHRQVRQTRYLSRGDQTVATGAEYWASCANDDFPALTRSVQRSQHTETTTTVKPCSKRNRHTARSSRNIIHKQKILQIVRNLRNVYSAHSNHRHYYYYYYYYYYSITTGTTATKNPRHGNDRRFG